MLSNEITIFLYFVFQKARGLCRVNQSTDLQGNIGKESLGKSGEFGRLFF
jgi:hypothetical protein